jgi:hypothetical protein
MLKARLLLGALAVILTGCAGGGDVTTLELQDISSGYYDEGVVDGANKIVPSFTFKLHNKGAEPVGSVQLNVHFRADGADGNMDEALVRGSSDAMAPQQSSQPIAVRSKVGYTGQQPRAEMLTNSAFKDVHVRVFGKSGSGQWAPIGEFIVERRIITQ